MRKLITPKEGLFLLTTFLWILFWSLYFLPYFNNFLTQNPNFPTPYAFLIHQFGYWLSMFLIGFLFTRKLPHSLRFSLGSIFLLIAYEIAVPPTCIAPDGSALITPDNQSCRMGNDYFISWVLNKYFGVPYNQPIMFYLTYIGGALFFAFLGVLLLKEKELWKAFLRG